MIRNILLLLSNLALLVLLFYIVADIREWSLLLKGVLIIGGIFLFIAICVSLIRHFIARSINKQKATLELYFKRLFKAQLWTYIICLSVLILLLVSWYYDRQDQKARVEADKLLFTSEEGLNMEVLMDAAKKDSIAQKLSTSKNYIDKTRKLISYIEYSFPTLVDSVCFFNHDSIASSTHIKVTDIHLSYELNYLSDIRYWVKIVYTYKHIDESFRHVILYGADTKIAFENHKSGRYYDLSEWRDEDLEYTNSDIEVRLIDSSVIRQIKSNYDSKHIVDTQSNDSWREEHYLSNDSIVSWILYDSSENIIAINRWSNGSLFYRVEYYDNGQQKSSIFTKELSENDTTFTKYYYRNGRIKKMGYWTDKQIGKWYSYDSSGKLLFTQIY